VAVFPAPDLPHVPGSSGALHEPGISVTLTYGDDLPALELFLHEELVGTITPNPRDNSRVTRRSPEGRCGSTTSWSATVATSSSAVYWLHLPVRGTLSSEELLWLT
jgi:hypothetical protein